jgi:hypothetical protein
MSPIWSPEAIDDLVALRTYIEQDDPQRRNESLCTSSTTWKYYFLPIRRWAGRVAFRERVSW